MRRLLVAVSVAGLLLVNSLAVGAAAPANFAGTWALDKAKSKDLPPQMENIKTYTLTVTQDAQQLTTDTKIERAENAEGGGGPGMGGPGGGGGGRRGGGMMGRQNIAYK